MHLVLHPLVPDHPVVDAHVLGLDRQRGLGRHGVEDKVVIAVRAVLVGLLELLRVLAETLLALLAGEGEVELLADGVRLVLGVALGAIVPFSTWGVVRPGRRGGDGGVSYSMVTGWTLERLGRVC